MSKRNRDREDAGKSAASWQKHKIIKQAADGQINAWRASHPNGKIAIVDANAGDGEGVPCAQGDLFDDSIVSLPTSALAASLAVQHGADVFLCEKDAEKRGELLTRFPWVTVLGDHALAPAQLNGYQYALIISDPCGPAGHGIEHLQAMARKIRHADFIVVFDEQFLVRLAGVAPPAGDDTDKPQRRAWETSRQRYAPMIDPQWWPTTLERQRLARTCLIPASPAFHFRILVITNYLSHAAQRPPFKVFS